VLPDDVIAIDAGTTAFQVAQALPDDFFGTVVTHSIPVLDFLLDRPATKTIALGGDVFRPSRALVGSSAVDCARRLRVRTFYLGAAAVDTRGIYASADVERLVKRTLMEIADRTVLIIDHSKFDVKAPVFLCDWDRLDTVVSDRAPPEHILQQLSEKHVRMLIPAPDGVVRLSDE
jgi:DeoR/GlpR family transcriptional regulator of sugar metabolism